MKQFKLIAFIVLALAGLLTAGCDVGVNPLLFDGVPLTATFRVDDNSSIAFAKSETINLQDALDEVDDVVDSIRVFNVTLKIDSLTDGTVGTTTISGNIQVDGNTIFTVNNVPLSTFETEQSIFSNITGFSYNDAGVQYLLNLARQNPLPTVTVAALGTASSANLHFTAKLKLYTQVFTEPPNGGGD